MVMTSGNIQWFQDTYNSSESLPIAFGPMDYSPKPSDYPVFMAQTALNTSSPSHMELARFWLTECLKKHDNCRLKNSSFSPTRLIEVGTADGRLPIRLSVNGNSFRHTHYCALSHCWGTPSERLNLTTKNIGIFQERIPLSSLPSTFQDAIRIARALGQKHLWIDSLCIIQDSIDDWTRESSKTVDVYEHSISTIAAAAGESDDKGIFFDRDPLTYTWCIVAESANIKRKIYVAPQVDELGSSKPGLLHNSPSVTRAWTFQERILSRRILYFGPVGMFWECRKGTATGEYIARLGTGLHLNGRTPVRPTISHIWD